MFKKLLTLLLLTTAIPLSAENFNFSKELNETKDLSSSFDLIASYHNIIQQVTESDSTRLAKKLVKFIKNLHAICSEEEDIKIKFMYKKLLEQAIANDKLSSVDYVNELPLILEAYAEIEDPDKKEPEPDEEIWGDADPNNPDRPVEPEVKPEHIIKLCDDVKEINRNSVIPRLSLKKILNDIERLTRDFSAMQTEIARLSTQDYMLDRIFKKLITIEKLIKQNGEAPCFSIDSLTLDELCGDPIYRNVPHVEVPEEYEEFSPLTQKLISEELEED